MVNKCEINEQMNEWYICFYIVLNSYNNPLEQRKGKNKIGNKPQVGLEMPEQSQEPFSLWTPLSIYGLPRAHVAVAAESQLKNLRETFRAS